MKRKLYKVGIWGQFGDGGVIADGQAVRTTIITEEIENRYGKENVLRLNSNQWYKHPFSFFINTVKLEVESQAIIIFPADNGFKMIVPLFTFLNKIFKRKLYDVVIGGYLPRLLRDNPKYVKQLKQFDALFVQTPNIKADLEKIGLNNIQYITNLKRLHKVSKEELSINTNEEVKLCFFARVTEDKGIVDAIKAVKLANTKLGRECIKLDVYGIAPEAYKPVFENLLEQNATFVEYKGVAHYNKTVEVMKNYFALLFPSYFHGEGFPGCFVDAFSSGLPVIATDWLYNKDIVHSGENGILVPIKDPVSLCDAILTLYNDREVAYQYALKNLEESEQFNPDFVLKDLYKLLEQS